MTFDEFEQAFEERRRQDPFLFEDNDPLATNEELLETEDRLGCTIGEKYSTFLARYGGGATGACVIFSAHPTGDWYVVKENLTNAWQDRGLLAFSPDLAGDYYLFAIKDGIAQDRVLFYDHETGSVSQTEYSDLYEYILATCG